MANIEVATGGTDDAKAPLRIRTVTWDDPVVASRAGSSLSGIEHLRAMAEGRISPPPIMLLLGFNIDEVSEGRVCFTVEPGEHHYNPIGVAHGGLAATLLDSAMGCAVHSLLPKGRGYSTLELKVNFVKALKRDSGRVRAIGNIVHMGSRIATADGRLIGADGQLFAHATSTLMLFG
jgi:uncharacterized protein (TIGR00369 family)